jgi:hypothetical protein
MRKMPGGFVLCFGYCFGCGDRFAFNPHHVPSIGIHGVREPICHECVARANIKREANGLAPIVPLPGAYDPLPEEEL